MSAENSPERQLKTRGGCLDSLVKRLTFGRYGIETSIKQTAEERDNVSVDTVDNDLFQQSMLDHGEPVVLHNLHRTQIVTRKIVKVSRHDTSEKADGQEKIDKTKGVSFDVRTVAGRYEITKKPGDFV